MWKEKSQFANPVEGHKLVMGDRVHREPCDYLTSSVEIQSRLL